MFAPQDPQAVAAANAAAQTYAQQDTGSYADIAALANTPGVAFQNLWILRHLQAVNRSQASIGMPANLKVDLAQLPDGTNQLLSSAGLPAYTRPSALAEVWARAGEQHAHTIPINDMLEYGRKLKSLGYLEPDYTPTGIWDSHMSGGHYRYGADLAQAHLQGSSGFLSATAKRGFGYMASMAPSGVVKGFWGLLKGVWGTLEDLGLSGHGLLEGDFSGVKEHWARDLFNVVSVASLASGLGELSLGASTVAAAGATDLGAEAAGAAIEAAGAGAGRVLTAPELGQFTSRPLLSIMRGLGAKESADATADFIGKWGINAWNENSEVFQAARHIYGVGLRGTALPRALAVFQPQSQMGKDYLAGPRLPLWVDIPLALMVHPIAPGTGSNLTPNIFHRLISEHVAEPDPWKLNGMVQPTVDEAKYAAYEVAVKRDVEELVSKHPDYAEMMKRPNGAPLSTARKAARAAVVAPLRTDQQALEEYVSKAVQAAEHNADDLNVYLNELRGSGQNRAAEGFISNNAFGDYVHMQTMADDINMRIGDSLGGDRVTLMRIDNPQTRQVLSRILKVWTSGTAEELDAARAHPEMQKVLRILYDGAPPERAGNITKDLKEWLKHSAIDMTDDGRLLPEEVRMATDGKWKLVRTGPNYLTPNEIMTTGAAAPVFSKHQYIAELLHATDTTDMRSLMRNTTHQAWNERLMEHGLEWGSGEQLMKSLSQDVRANQRDLVLSSTGAKQIDKWKFRLAARALTIQDMPASRIMAKLRAPLEEGGFGYEGEDAFRLGKLLHQDAMTSWAAPGMPYSVEENFIRMRQMARALRIHGLQGVSEMVRSAALPGGLRTDMPEWMSFLPESSMRLARTLRFQLNPLFNARVFAKDQVLAMASEDLSPVLKPLRKMMKVQPDGTRIWDEALALRLKQGGIPVDATDDMERVFAAEGYLANNISHLDMYNDWRVFRKRIGIEAPKGVEEAEARNLAYQYVKDNNYHWTARPGPRSPLEKSANFLFFPFSFEKKLLTTVGGYVADEPIRAILISEAARRYDMLNKLDEHGRRRWSSLVKRYLPIANEIAKLNAFGHGLGLGELDVGKLGNTKFPNPMGALYGPLANALGSPVEFVHSATHPVLINQENYARLQGIGGRMFPFYNAVNDFFKDISDQTQVIFKAPHESTVMQVDDYETELRATQERYINIGLGYGAMPTIGSFERDPRIPVIYKQAYYNQVAQLNNYYPIGASISSSLAGSGTQPDQKKLEILGKVTRTPAENGVVQMEYQLAQLDQRAAQGGTGALARLWHQRVTAGTMRDVGVRIYDSMPSEQMRQDFLNFWRVLGYFHRYGPIAQADVALES